MSTSDITHLVSLGVLGKPYEFTVVVTVVTNPSRTRVLVHSHDSGTTIPLKDKSPSMGSVRRKSETSHTGR